MRSSKKVEMRSSSSSRTWNRDGRTARRDQYLESPFLGESEEYGSKGGQKEVMCCSYILGKGATVRTRSAERPFTGESEEPKLRCGTRAKQLGKSVLKLDRDGLRVARSHTCIQVPVGRHICTALSRYGATMVIVGHSPLAYSVTSRFGHSYIRAIGKKCWFSQGRP